ncbi:MAG TPA: AMP-binding protein [Acidimicrobiia bacterium]|nr:AMP-binding protein [Acidimicrobiia bacterium]
MPIHDIVDYAASNWPERPAVAFEERTITFAELARESARLANGLRALTEPGDRVAILARNIPEYVECLYGVPRAGLVLTLLNYRLHPREWAWILTAAGVRVLIVQPDLLPAIEPMLAEVESLEHVVVIGDDVAAPARGYDTLKSHGEADAPAIEEASPAFLIYTSGTTGFPKGAVISHRAARMAAVTNALESELRADDSFLMTFPMCHASGFQVLVHHCRGVPVVLFESFEPGRFLELIEHHRVTRTALAPTMALFVLDHPAFADTDLSSIRVLSYGGMPMPAPIARRLAARFGALSTGFGQSETTLLVTALTTDDHRRALAGDAHVLESIGRPIGMAAVAVLDDELRVCAPGEPGELCVRGDLVMTGYWNDPDATATAFAGGWLHTGDIARTDTEGYLYLVDRKKDLIISGGQNIYPTEIERVLQELPGVAQVAVVGGIDDMYGERVVAFVVRVPERDLSGEDVVEHCRTHLAGYKKPRQVVFVDDLPKTITGKVKKQELRALL